MRSTLLAAMLLSFMIGSPLALAAEPDRSVRKMLDKRKVSYEVDKDGDFKLSYDMGGGRSQVVFVRSATLEYGKLRIREIFSTGYRADGNAFPAAVANRMLEIGSQAKLGAWTKLGSLGVFTTRIAANASEQELLGAIELTGTLADELEKELSGSKDEF